MALWNGFLLAERTYLLITKKGVFVKKSQGQGDWYDIVRRSDGKLMGSMPLESRNLVYIKNGMFSCRPLMEDESVFNLSSGTRFLRRLGYRLEQPSDIMISTD
ncbi:hypothetical protein BWI95_18925 [Kosakonia cowanii JCM 10956 = DSM 18146]|uniref:Uncharacterized protein n=1 Tax=Kosakonia cowanii JCM 10956 = DSM 18146 TaxID=1300165 RepID=A0A807LLK7_9ENTR|nr:hypothetical protein BWI95_18925 [Kosakonia cowanii JCM 10956 = DSM 18146]